MVDQEAQEREVSGGGFSKVGLGDNTTIALILCGSEMSVSPGSVRFGELHPGLHSLLPTGAAAVDRREKSSPIHQ